MDVNFTELLALSPLLLAGVGSFLGRVAPSLIGAGGRVLSGAIQAGSAQRQAQQQSEFNQQAVEQQNLLDQERFERQLQLQQFLSQNTLEALGEIATPSLAPIEFPTFGQALDTGLEGTQRTLEFGREAGQHLARDALDFGFEASAESLQRGQDLSQQSLDFFDQLAGQFQAGETARFLSRQESVNPLFRPSLSEAQQQTLDLIRGVIPEDVSAELLRQDAQKALNLGTAGTGAARALVARDLGRTSLDLQREGFGRFQNLTQLTEQAVDRLDLNRFIINPKEFTLSPAQFAVSPAQIASLLTLAPSAGIGFETTVASQRASERDKQFAAEMQELARRREEALIEGRAAALEQFQT